MAALVRFSVRYDAHYRSVHRLGVDCCVLDRPSIFIHDCPFNQTLLVFRASRYRLLSMNRQSTRK